MSDHIPVELQLEIMKWLPVKSLIQFRSVSQTWNSIIDSSDFKNSHHSQVQHLLVHYDVRYGDDEVDYEESYVSIVDDHTFPHQKASLTLPPLVKKLECPCVTGTLHHPLIKMLECCIIGSSHGLLGLYSHYHNRFRKPVVVLWNPSIRKAVAVIVPMRVSNIGEFSYDIAVGFGVCRETNEPKIVKITYNRNVRMTVEGRLTTNPPEVEVFTLSTRAWRRSYGNLPRESIHFLLFSRVFTNGVFYWLATDEFSIDRSYKLMIISFNMTSEELMEITLPDSINSSYFVFMSKLGESLVVVCQDEHEGCDVWMMEDGVPKSFTKLFTFTTNKDAIVRGFRKSGGLIIDVPQQGEVSRGQLAIYEPYLKNINNLGIEGLHGSFDVSNYRETLFLFDQPDHMVYNGT